MIPHLCRSLRGVGCSILRLPVGKLLLHNRTAPTVWAGCIVLEEDANGVTDLGAQGRTENPGVVPL
jgi:hypothetical protein